MKLLQVSKSQFTVAAVLDEKDNEDSCPALDFLESLENTQYEGSKNGMLALMNRIAKGGTNNLSSKLCHYVDQNEKIYELIKGKLRLFFFKGHCDLIVIVSHGTIKKSQKTKEKDIKKAIKYKKKYQQAHDTNNVELLEELS